MPQKLFLIRHGKPQFPTEERYCLGGRTDWPLDETGREQCKKMAEEFFRRQQEFPEAVQNLPEAVPADSTAALRSAQRKKRQIWSSPMIRAVQTASFLCEKEEAPETLELLREMDAGEWDGKSFSQIQKEYPQAYAARKGKQGMTLIPGAESDEEGLARFAKGVEAILSGEEEADILIVAHATVIQLFLCFLAGKPLSESREFKPEYAQMIELDAGEIRRKLERRAADS